MEWSGRKCGMILSLFHEDLRACVSVLGFVFWLAVLYRNGVRWVGIGILIKKNDYFSYAELSLSSRLCLHTERERIIAITHLRFYLCMSCTVVVSCMEVSILFPKPWVASTFYTMWRLFLYL